MRVFIIHHGQTVSNANKVVSGSHESPLTELGRHQIQFEAEKALHLGIELIVCSPMQRAIDSARIVADTLNYPRENIRVMEQLRERGLGELEQKSYAHNDRLSGNYPETETVPAVEPIATFHARVQAALRDLLQTRRYHTVLIVCHMNVGRMLEVVAANKPPLSMYDMPRLDNAHLKRLL